MITKIVLIVSVFILSCLLCNAQVEGGITDQNEKVIVNAKVIALDQNKNIVDTTSADRRGFYLFTRLKKGKYTIQVKATGFEDGVEENVNVLKEMTPGSLKKDITSATRLDFILNPLKK